MRTCLKAYLMILFLACPFLSNGQVTPRMLEVMDIINANDSIAEELFLDTSTIRNMFVSDRLKYRRVWYDINDSIKSISQFYDIRVRFDSDSAALAFHREYMEENSESGPKVKTRFKSPEGVKDLRLFTQNEKISRAFLEPNGYRAYCFLFVVDNYTVKFYIICLTTYKPDYFLPYIISARDKIRALKEKDSGK
jgi:hypothetical protein